MKPFFSIVIPCCNVEPYVEECLLSVLGQSFQSWECLITIETSNDKTEEVTREIISGDARFRIFTGPRTGSCSESRNIGIDNAQGEYVIFLDGDDTIADGCLERLHKKISSRPGADLYPCAIVTRNEIGGTDEIRDNYKPDCPAELNGVEATLYLEKHWRGSFCPMLQLTVFRREFLVKHQLKCIRGLRCQDSEFSPRALYLAKRVVPLHEPFYLYRIRTGSVQTMAKGLDYFFRDWAIITGSLIDFYGRASKLPDFDPSVTPCWIRQWLSRMNSMWFSARALQLIPRQKRLETLRIVFANGFDFYRSMLKSGSRAQRMAGFWVRVFVRYPSMRWAAELFFRLYFRIAHNQTEGTNNLGFRNQIAQQS